MLTKEDRALVCTALAWAPYGGATDEDLFVNFGLSTDEFYNRVRAALDRDRNGHHLSAADHRTLAATCRLHVEGAFGRRSESTSLR
ncbi:hypothetical protein [Rhodococcus oxybenzonivorans]|uniref:hypothetical protein n=1 Tax=Rhodococcus oxybenzonivorans TaxID=1990687 RepID=UPI000D69988F|nr:hypothetical protein [Rhodococcus oxybenzonivorans]